MAEISDWDETAGPPWEPDQHERANNCHERLWRDHAIVKGTYRGLKVPAEVLRKMREARSEFLRRPHKQRPNPAGWLGQPIATFAVHGVVWKVYEDGCTTVAAVEDADKDFDFNDDTDFDF
jgi:hypothetical protein